MNLKNEDSINSYLNVLTPDEGMHFLLWYAVNRINRSITSILSVRKDNYSWVGDDTRVIIFSNTSKNIRRSNGS